MDKVNDQGLCLTGYAPTEPIVQEMRVTGTVDEALAELPPGLIWSVACYSSPDGGANLAKAISEGTSIAVSDGSLKFEFGTSALTLQARNCKVENEKVRAVNVIPGRREDQSSYRSEIGGIFGIVVYVGLVCKVFKITQGKITVGCDGIEALKSVFLEGEENEIDISHPDYDMVSAIQKLIRESPIEWCWRHMKGHQDDDGSAVLDKWAELNIEMDNLAKAYWMHQAPYGPSNNIVLEGEMWTLRVQGHKVSGRADEVIYDHIHGEAMFARWERKGRFQSLDYSRKVNWEAIGQAMKSLKIGRRHWVAKHCLGHCGVNAKMKEWKKRDSSDCPRCGKRETARHVWRCQDPEARLVKSRGMLGIRKFLIEEETQPDMSRIIMACLTSWSMDTSRYPQRTSNAEIREALDIQDQGIGWTSFFEGCIAMEWTKIQEAYYKRIGSRKSGRRWTIELIKKLFDVAWDLWDHRNDVNNAKKNQATLYNMKKVDPEIRSQFRRGSESMPQRYEYLFAGSVEDLLKSSVQHRLSWIKSVRKARSMNTTRKERREQSFAASRQFMHEWLSGRRG